jgi:hypothetical protein
MKNPSLNRRRFIRQSASVTAAAFALPNLLLHGQDAASKRLNIAVIGALCRPDLSD